MSQSNRNHNTAFIKEEPLFTFVVTTDSHIMLEEGDHSSAYPSSIKEFNDRTRYLIQEINRLSPDFVINLGDFVQPVPSLPTYEPAVQMAKDIYSKLEPKMYATPGNHDIGDKKAGWMPGPKINDEAIALYEKYWEKSYSSFDFNDIHFVLVNTPVLNSGLEYEQEQKKWLENDLEKNKDKRIFMFTHYPLYLRYPDEDEHYDNIAEPGRSWLLSLIKKYNVEMLYTGHVHNYFYDEYGQTKQYVLPALSFVRPDYNELYQIECGSEGGRNDIYKFGFFFVKVYKDTHVNQLIRTYGKLLDKNEEANSDKKILATYHTLENEVAPIGVYLRHSWAENHIIPFANLDEFSKKVVRNDYPILSLWDLGIKKVRIPLGDLYLPDTLERIQSLKAYGHEFTIFTTGVPTQKTKDSIIKYHDLIDAWEITLSRAEMTEALPHIQEVKKKVSVKTYLSKIETSADHQEGTRFHHFIRHGFDTKDVNLLAELQADGILNLADGLVFNLTPEQSPLEKMEQAKKIADRYDLAVSLHVQMRGADTPSYEHRDDHAIANRIAEVVASTLSVEGVDVFLDTFMDHDRAYFIRNGLIDRKSNPRLQYHVFKYLYSALVQTQGSQIATIEENDQYKELKIVAPSQKLHLFLPKNKHVKVESVQTEGLSDDTGTGYTVNLETGVIEDITWEKSDAHNIIVSRLVECSVPTVLIFNNGIERPLSIEGNEKKRTAIS